MQLKQHTGLFIIISAALLLEITSGVMYYISRNIIQETMEQMVEREMNAIYLRIRNKLARVEVTVDNMNWVVASDLPDPDIMFENTRLLVENNPEMLGSSITFIPNYYPQKGYWFEPYSVRRPDGTIESIQLGSATHDYTQQEFYTEPIARNRGHWSEPYQDKDGAKAIVTTYGVPVYDEKGKVVAVADADISLNWLEDVLHESEIYPSTQRFLLTGSHHLLAGQDNAMLRIALACMQDNKDHKGYVTAKNEKNDKVHIFYHPVGGMTDWILILVLDDSEVFGELRITLWGLFFLVLVGFGIIGFIVYHSSQNLEHLREMNAEKERIGSELRIASQIQQKMLPVMDDNQKIEIGGDFDIFGSLVPAREVGGDLFDYFLRNDKLFFAIGDVSGKGVPAAMLMAQTLSLLRAPTRENNPAHIISMVNDSLCKRNDSNMFVTLFVGVLDLPTGQLRYCSAGHDAPFIVEGDTLEVVSLAVNPHLPVGVFDDTQYGVQEIQLVPGSTLFLYTDGLTESKNNNHQFFGLERVKKCLTETVSHECEPQSIEASMQHAVDEFVDGAEQNDDLTMLVIRYTPHIFDPRWSETLTITNDVREVARLSEFTKSVFAQMKMDKSLAQQLRLGIEEAVVNVIEYAYPAGQKGNIDVQILFDGEWLKVVITDKGVAFDPTIKSTADTSLSAEDRQIGGLGILLVRELMDVVNYERIKGCNILTLLKKTDTYEG